jgi:hypothetical protein
MRLKPRLQRHQARLRGLRPMHRRGPNAPRIRRESAKADFVIL